MDEEGLMTAEAVIVERSAADYVRGALCGLAAVSIWSGGIVAAGFGLRTSLSAWDIAAIRFGVAGLLLLPYVLSKGLAAERLGWGGLAAIVLGGGAPVLLGNAGLMFAPAAHAGALYPGVMPLMVALLAAIALREAITARKRVGFALIVPGVLAIVVAAGGSLGARQNIGHALFVGSALSFAFYTVAMRRARLDGLHAAALAAVGDLLLYLPVYALVAGASLAQAAWTDIAVQAVIQGVLTAIVSYLLFGRAVELLGASSGAAFAALCPAMTALIAMPVLGEWPKPIDWLAIVAISAGVYVVSGGPLPRALSISRAWRPARECAARESATAGRPNPQAGGSRGATG
jgi:drug/metabolite transporter (DMT)-like permease